MARIRTVKPEFWADEKVASMPRDARLLFIGLFNFADDEGRLRGSPLLVRAQVFPYDIDIDAENLLRILAEASLIVRYEVEAESYVWIRNFNRHQKIDKPSKSVLPPIPQTRSTKVRRIVAEDSTGERKGKEGNGSGNVEVPDAQSAETQPPAPATDFVVFIRSEWPDVKNPEVLEQRAREANPGIDLLAEAKKARGWELSDPKRRKRSHGKFLWGWLGRAQDSASKKPFTNGKPLGPGAAPAARKIASAADFEESEREFQERMRREAQ